MTHPTTTIAYPTVSRNRQSVPEMFRDSMTPRRDSDRIRVVLIDGDAMSRIDLSEMLTSACDVVLVGDISTSADAFAMMSDCRPHVVVVELSAPGDHGVAAISALVRMGCSGGVVVMITRDDDDDRRAAMNAGASGHFMKCFADRELLNAVRAVAHGNSYIGATPAHVVVRHRAEAVATSTQRLQFDRLTARERSVLMLVGQGYSAPEIGKQLSISAKTVDSYKARIHDKLGLAHRAEYVQFVHHLGLLTTS